MVGVGGSGLETAVWDSCTAVNDCLRKQEPVSVVWQVFKEKSDSMPISNVRDETALLPVLLGSLKKALHNNKDAFMYKHIIHTHISICWNSLC